MVWGVLAGSLLPLVFRRLGFDPAVSSAPFGATLHVTGTDPAALEAALGAAGVAWQPSQTSLEDVFIRLMEQSQDNMT